MLIIFVVALFAFFVALGALKPGQVVGLSIAVVVLAALWVAHAVWVARHHRRARPGDHPGPRAPRLLKSVRPAADDRGTMPALLSRLGIRGQLLIAPAVVLS